MPCSRTGQMIPFILLSAEYDVVDPVSIMTLSCSGDKRCLRGGCRHRYLLAGLYMIQSYLLDLLLVCFIVWKVSLVRLRFLFGVVRLLYL
ncbi:uncharacterized protein BO80DRAFT_259041 [Aspergillus ibericus CBS 121593]|uniref:Uncharacterized protein n=1 Tax=Aspergillus ibericus CBS 121593 TaxID=1448316 RepID=A0A395H979_9EURO|nr:hypothetical protein BO80DRAFT_259041 [Aspergillus ibericus CBS 121593]RAL04230.1 hypothetical protein BO80DRAFT_259041 [Aspergillus ibericus CBS 121593]